MATPNIVPRADSEGGLGTSSKYWAAAYIDAITTTGNVVIGGTLTVSAADSITIADYVLHSGDDSKFGFPSNDNFKIRLAGNDEFTISASAAVFNTTLAATSFNGIPFFTDTTNNSMYTHDVSGTDDSAAQNTAYGFQALDAITTGDDNTAIGFAAGSAITTGLYNIAIGSCW